MRLNQKNFRQSTVSHHCVLALLPVAAMLVAGGAHAQSSGCDQFKDTLAARVDPSIRGFTLDVVPSAAPVPSGAKVFGTCDGGAFKILFRRGGSTRPAPADVSAASAVPSPPAAKVQVEPVKPAAAVQVDRPAKPEVAPAPPPVALPPVTSPPVVPEPVSADKTADKTTDKTDRAVTPPTAQAQADDSASSKSGPAADEAPDFIADNWRWLVALLLVPIAVGLWRWYAYRSAYDEAGLPRGPKIRV